LRIFLARLRSLLRTPGASLFSRLKLLFCMLLRMIFFGKPLLSRIVRGAGFDRGVR